MLFSYKSKSQHDKFAEPCFCLFFIYVTNANGNISHSLKQQAAEASKTHVVCSLYLLHQNHAYLPFSFLLFLKTVKSSEYLREDSKMKHFLSVVLIRGKARIDSQLLAWMWLLPESGDWRQGRSSLVGSKINPYRVSAPCVSSILWANKCYLLLAL